MVNFLDSACVMVSSLLIKFKLVFPEFWRRVSVAGVGQQVRAHLWTENREEVWRVWMILSSPVFASECSPAPGLAGAGSLVFVGGKFLPGSATPVIGTIRDKNIIWDTDTQLTLTK